MEFYKALDRTGDMSSSTSDKRKLVQTVKEVHIQEKQQKRVQVIKGT